MTRLTQLKHLALDLDGTLYLGGTLFPFTKPFLATLGELGLGRTFFTNNSSVSTLDYVKKLNKLGIDATEADIYSSTSATLDFLREQGHSGKTLFVLGTPSLRQEFAANGYRVLADGEDATAEPDLVIAGFDTTLDYERLCRTAWWVSRGKPYFATHGDAVCPTDKPTVLPDCGAVCALIQHATGRAPDAVLGKPAPGMLAGITRRHGIRPDEIAVVGDRLYTDMAMAHAAGATGILVLSGESTRAQADRADPSPHYVVENVKALGELLRSQQAPPTAAR